MAKEFKSGLDKILQDIAEDVELGETFWTKFDANWFKDYDQDPELYDPLFSLFQRSKLNPKWPGHWQFLLLAVANEIYSKRTGREVVWDSEEDEKLFRAVLKQRRARAKKDEKISIKAICIELKNTPSFKKAASADALHARFNIVIRNKRKQAKAKDASPTLKRDLKWFSSSHV